MSFVGEVRADRGLPPRSAKSLAADSVRLGLDNRDADSVT